MPDWERVLTESDRRFLLSYSGRVTLTQNLWHLWNGGGFAHRATDDHIETEDLPLCLFHNFENSTYKIQKIRLVLATTSTVMSGMGNLASATIEFYKVRKALDQTFPIDSAEGWIDNSSDNTLHNGYLIHSHDFVPNQNKIFGENWEYDDFDNSTYAVMADNEAVYCVIKVDHNTVGSAYYNINCSIDIERT